MLKIIGGLNSVIRSHQGFGNLVAVLPAGLLVSGCGGGGGGETSVISSITTVVAGSISAILPTPTPSPTPTPTPTPVAAEARYWVECAKEGETCTLPIVANTRVRYGAGDKFAYLDVGNSVICANGSFGGDPVYGVAKTCAYASVTPTAPVAVVEGKPSAARDRLGINVVGVSYYGGEPTFANQLFGLRWLVPSAGWSGVGNDRLRPDGFPLSVDESNPATPKVVSILSPPMESMTTDTAVTRCTWQGTGDIAVGGYANDRKAGDHRLEFRWNKEVGHKNVVWVEINRSSAADPIRAMDCRLTTDPANTVFSAQILQYLKPFGVIRFLDQSAANSNPASVTWATRSQPGDLIQRGTDSLAIEHMVALANANGSSPWFTVPWNADADYQRRMAQLVHDSIPAGKPVYVEISNEVWNYQFGQASQAQKEGLERKLSENGFGANLARYAQKITEVMPIWADVFKDRPKDLVRIAATQSANAWVGTQILEWNNGAVVPFIDAMAIAPYFQVDPVSMTGDQAANMALVAAEAKKQIAVSAAAYKVLTSRYGKRLIAYEGGQHQIDPDNQARLEAINRDPAMQAIYSQYLTDWQALTGDLFTLYSTTGPYSRFGAWGLREYAGQPVSETPKLRGVLDFAGR